VSEDLVQEAGVMTKEKSLILGGLGFIGHNLAIKLRKADHEILIADSNIQNQTWNSKIENPFNCLNFDLANSDLLQKTISDFQPNNIFHFAANSDISKSDAIANDFWNTLVTTLSLAEVLRVTNLEAKVVFASSSAIYGDKGEPLRISSPKINVPANAYGWSKRASELALQNVCNEKDIPLVVCRFPNVVGPHLTHGLLFDLLKKNEKSPKTIQILGDGTQKKPFIHVDDLLEILLKVNGENDEPDRIINISPFDQITVSEIVEIFASVITNEVDFLYEQKREGWKGDVPEYLFDVSEAQQMGTLAVQSSRVAVERSLRENMALL